MRSRVIPNGLGRDTIGSHEELDKETGIPLLGGEAFLKLCGTLYSPDNVVIKPHCSVSQRVMKTRVPMSKTVGNSFSSM